MKAMAEHQPELIENPANIIFMTPPVWREVLMEISMPSLPPLYEHIPNLPKRIDVELRVRIRR